MSVAVIGVASPPYRRTAGRSALGLVLDACVDAVRDAGIDRNEIDGICGTQIAAAHLVQGALGIPSINWWCNTQVPFQHAIIESVNAIYAGICSTVLCYHGSYRNAATSADAASDPIRRRYTGGLIPAPRSPDTLAIGAGYAAWAGRYLHEYGRGRTGLARVVVNSRSHAVRNPHAVARTPLTIDEYLAAPMVRSPFSKLDMDYPVDGADAFVLTTVDRARGIRPDRVVIGTAVLGQGARSLEHEPLDFADTGQVIAARALWARSELTRQDVDVFYPYDGFSIIALRWFEALGFCGDGEAEDFLAERWDEEACAIRLNGKLGVNTHGGSLSDGATQGSGHFREAVLQLRGSAQERQVSDSQVALIAQGGFFVNAGALVLLSERDN
jgi:acetyl-CoA acetyltransferase